MLQSINPKNMEILAQFEEMKDIHVKELIQQSNAAFLNWKKESVESRSGLVQNLGKELRKSVHLLSRYITDEMGKPMYESKSEILKCASLCDFYAEMGGNFLKSEIQSKHALISYQPLGVILGIMPWNFPFWQVLRFAVPTLLAGNACLMKHAPNVTLCALEIESLFRKAGFPDHIFQTLVINHKKVEWILNEPSVKAVSLTGSTRAGSAVASLAGRSIKKSVLELGGSDPYLILDDADLEHAITCCVTSRLINAGQSCVAAKRFIVTEPVYDDFLRGFLKSFSEKRYGDPYDEVDMGPLARIDLRDQLHHQVTQSVAKGAVCELGGEIPDMEGAFYPPTVLTNVSKGMPAYEEELFGPVASIIKVNNEREAIQVANDSIYGLGAAVFTKDPEKGKRIAEYELNAGNCFINDFVKSSPELPFGGINQSGFGRELGLFGIREFVNIKTVYGN
jgi:succinate-semialdehyde dehydrogenase/glutarate-semialdehyde dehydrogenase